MEEEKLQERKKAGCIFQVGAGIIGGLGLILVEILYHKHKIRKEKRADAAHMAITKWKGTIEVGD